MNGRDDKDRFFSMADTYDRMCGLLVPRYSEMQDEIFEILDIDREKKIRIIDLGAGSGKLLEKFLERFPASECVWVDFSEDFLKAAKKRLERFEGRAEFVLCDLDDGWEEKTGRKAEVIVSMSAIHHLESRAKRGIYRKCFDMLTSGGWFFNVDEMRTFYDDAYLDEMNYWYRFVTSKKDGFTGELKDYYDRWMVNFDRWKTRNIDNADKTKSKGDDMHDGIIPQLDWLKESGFGKVDLFCKYHLWNLIGGKKII
jgi:tRNA (cmo5U34)-methyltransferase